MLSASVGPCRDDSVNSVFTEADGGAAPAVWMVNPNVDFQYAIQRGRTTSNTHKNTCWHLAKYFNQAACNPLMLPDVSLELQVSICRYMGW